MTFSRSLRVLIPMLLLLAGMLVVVVQYQVLLRHETENHRRDVTERLNAAGTRMAGMSRYLLAQQNEKALAIEVGLMATFPELLLAVVTDETDTIVYSTQQSWRAQSLAKSPLAVAVPRAAKARATLSSQVSKISDNNMLTGTYAFLLPVKPDSLEPQGKGVVVIGLDLTNSIQAARRNALSIAAISAGTVLLVSLLLWYLLHRLLVRPVNTLVSTTRAIAAGDFAASANIQPGSELSEISIGLDRLSGAIKSREHSLLSEMTEREEAEASNARLAQIVENSVNEVSVIDSTTHQYLSVNRSVRSNLGYTAEELLRLSPSDIMLGFDEAQYKDLLAPLINGAKDDLTFETDYQRQNGTTYPAEVRLQIMRSESPPVFVTIAQDITVRRQQLEDVLLRDRAIAELDTGVIITDARKHDNPIVYVNRALQTMTGYSSEDLIGRNPRLLQCEDQAQPELESVRAAIEKGVSVQVILKNYRKDGTLFMDELSIAPVRNHSGDLTHFVGIQRDVTSKLETEKRLLHAQKIDAIGQLSGGIAHDFNNLLSVIIGNLEFLDKEQIGDDLAQYVEEAESAARMGARLTRRLLTFARQSTLEPTVIDLNEQVTGAIGLLHSTIGETISISSRLASKLWTTRVDPSEVENTVVNLAINARDAMPNGGKIVIETSNVSVDSEDYATELGLKKGDYLKLSVSDTGTGMSPEVKARVFEPFFTTKEIDKGTGLGLASIYGFAKQSGGHVNVHSEIGYGTTVTVYLPKYSETHADSKPMNTPSITNTAHAATVLVVEDNKPVMKLTLRRLKALGYAAVQAESGPEAIKILENGAEVDLVFSDVVMAGGMSGYDVALWVQKNKPTCRVLLTSGFNEQLANEIEDAVEDIKLLQKPYNLPELQQAIENTMDFVTN